MVEDEELKLRRVPDIFFVCLFEAWKKKKKRKRRNRKKRDLRALKNGCPVFWGK